MCIGSFFHMKSEFADRETIGTQLAETKKAHLEGEPIEAGDLVNEFGKSYMRDLLEAAEDPVMPKRFYIMVVWEKMGVEKSRAFSFVFLKRTTIPAMEPETDVYFVDKHNGLIELLWSLPAYIKMQDVIEYPEDYDNQTVFSVKKYKELEAKSKKHRLLL